MKLKQAIELYRSKEKSTYPAENWIRLGQYLEPHLDEIIYFTEHKKMPVDNESLIKEIMDVCNRKMREASPENATYAVGKKDMYKCVIAVMEKYM